MTASEHPQPEDSDTKPCEAPGCPALVVRPPGMKSHRWNETRTCSRSCGSRLAATTRRGGETAPHRCALTDCDALVPRVDGEHESRYRGRKYCSEDHRREAQRVYGGTARKPPAWKVERRCACPCARAFMPNDKRQRYATHECSVAARRGRDGVEYARRKSVQKPELESEPEPPPVTKLVERARTVWRPASWGGEYTVVEQVEVVA